MSASKKKAKGSKRKASSMGGTDEVLQHVDALRQRTSKPSTMTLAQLPQASALYSEAREVCDMASADVLRNIETIAMRAVEQILATGNFDFDVPNRSTSNQMYIGELDRIVLKDQSSKRAFLSVAQVRKTTITARVLQLLHEVISRGIHITKRDLFYTDVKLFDDQKQSDAVLDDAATMSGCTRHSLGVVASAKGLVVGRLRFRDDGDVIDCARMGVGGKAIPPFMDKVSDVESDARFILLVEKDAAFMRLAEDRFYNTYPCVIISGKGQPDVATRLFLNKVRSSLKIPILGLFDADPYGLKILSVYMKGSKNMAYDAINLTTPDIKWLGVRPSDLDKYNIPQQCRLEMSEHDLKTGRELLNEDFIKANPKWHHELELMVKSKVKAEIQALSSFGFQYLSQVYLPKKLKEGDWI